jgi:hypothetical protein
MVEFDQAEAHRFFSADCFNKAWTLIDMEKRTAEQDQEMIRLNQTSIWHWTQRPDCTDKNLSIGYWQSSRIFSILGQADNALAYGQLCLDVSQSDETGAFYLAYSYEALARAAMVAGADDQVQEFLAKAREVANDIADDEEKGMVLSDLETIV